MVSELEQARIDLAAAYRLANMYGLNEGVCNHLTVTVPGEPEHFLLVAHGTHWSQVRASELLIVDVHGNLVEGDGKVEPTAFYIHARLHMARSDMRCLMHTHQPHTLAIAMTEGGRILPANQNALRYHDRIAYDDDYQGLALDTSEGDRMASVLGDKDILFMANHGVLVGAPSIAKAYDDLYYLEQTAKAQILAMSTGKPLKMVPMDIVEAAASQIRRDNAYAIDHFEGMKKVLDRTQPDYRD